LISPARVWLERLAFRPTSLLEKFDPDGCVKAADAECVMRALGGRALSAMFYLFLGTA
jgi:hypothetical protein